VTTGDNVVVFEPSDERLKVAEALDVLERYDAEPVGEAVAVLDIVEERVYPVSVGTKVSVYRLV
jgi:hypothetical protein